MSATEGAAPAERFHAFVSYAHEDIATARWLRRVAVSTWLPGRGRRRVFLDREDIVPRGPLPARVEAAVRNSDTLIVVCSSHAAASTWVEREVALFLSVRTIDDVIIVHVDAPGEPVVPPSLRAHLAGEHQPLRIDLRGLGRAARADEARRVAAAVVGMVSATALLDRRARWLRRMLAMFDVVVMLAVLWTAGRVAWQGSVYQAHERAMAGVAATLARQQLDDPRVQAQVAVLLDEGRDALFEQAARSAGADTTRRLFDATKAAYRGRCDRAGATLREIDPSSRWIWRRSVLAIIARCAAAGSPDELRRAAGELDADGVADWAALLASVGYVAEARQVVAGMDEGGARRRATVAVALTSGASALADLDDAVVAPPCDADEVLDMGGLVARADLDGHLGAPAVQAMVVAVAQCLATVDTTTELVWIRGSQVAAALAAIGQAGAARQYLAHLDETARTRPGVVAAEGLVWQGIALERLGDGAAGDRYRRARAVLFAPVEASRSWFEAGPVVITYTAAGRWREAYAIAAAIPDVYGRALAQLALLARWREQGRHREAWARRAGVLSGVFGS